MAIDEKKEWDKKSMLKVIHEELTKMLYNRDINKPLMLNEYHLNVRTIEKKHKQLLDKAIRETERAFGGCTKCYGKGYSTHMGSEEADHTPIQLMDFCSCSRGQQLKTLLKK